MCELSHRENSRNYSMSMSDSEGNTTANTPSIQNEDSISSEKYKNTLKLVHYNCESLRNKVNILEAECKEFDIVGITETWLNEKIDNEKLEIKGYKTPIRKDRDDGWGGVALYIKDELYYKRRLDLENPQLEAIWVEITQNNKTLLVCCIYRPPNSRAAYWQLLEDNIEHVKLQNPNKDLLMMGDLNCDVSKNNSKLSQILAGFNMKQLITKHTHITKKSRTLIDIIACTCPENVIGSGTTSPQLSNHCGVYACLGPSPNLRKANFKRKIWRYNEANWIDLNKDISSSNWDEILAGDDINSGVENFMSHYNKLLSKHIPNKSVLIRPNDKSWMNNKIRRTKRKRDRAHKKAVTTNSETDWSKYRRIRNEYTNNIKEAKDKYDDDLIETIRTNKSSNPKLWWKTLNHFTGKKEKSAHNNPMNIDGKIVHDDREKAEGFNSYFANQSNIDVTPEDIKDLGNPTTPEYTLANIDITTQNVEDILKSLNVTKASGPDGISPRMLRNSAKELAPVLQIIFSKSLQSETFPSIWKCANVSPIHKKDERELVENYRPISLLSCISKVFERCVCKDIMNFFREHHVINKAQAAYIGAGSSTITQLIELYDDILKRLDKGEDVHMVFCDCSKAFDRVWHQGLLFKLQQSGITGKLLNWLRNYLEDRKQCVVLNGMKSEPKSINAGVPQGSILGPIMFLIYANDIPTILESSTKLYADDTSLYVSDKDPNTANEKLSADLERLSAWSKKWKVIMNPEKTERMIISRKRNVREYELKMDGREISIVKHHKHLGIVLQSNGKWDKHIEGIIAKAKKKVDMMNALMYKLDRLTLDTLYKTFIRPKLEYGCILWDNCTLNLKIKLENVQLSAARIVTGAVKGTSHRTIYQESKWETLQERRNQQQKTMMYKIMNNLTPPTLKSLIPLQVHETIQYNLRQGNSLRLVKANSNAYRNSFVPTAVKAWNNLNDETRNIPTLCQFKRKIKGNKVKMKDRLNVGSRKGQIMLSRIKIGHSGLNKNLYDNHISESPQCDCGASNEDANHYFFSCQRHETARKTMLDSIPTCFDKCLNVFLNGDDVYDENQNKVLFKIVTKFIVNSDRFQ